MLVSCVNIEKSFGLDTILSGVSFRLAWGQKMGLVGRNGCGKTTLLHILSGQMEADRGSVSYTRGVRCGYLRQEQMVEHGWTVYQEAEDAFAPVLQMERRLRELEQSMAGASDAGTLQAVMDEYGLLHDRFEAMGGYENLRDIRLVLKRLGFGEEDLSRLTARLSGGEKTRLALAKLLLSAPDVLLLDEPTNHLDLQATEWLEDFLHDFGGAIILVSHDRYFLDRVVTTIAEIENARFATYRGNFSAYWTQKQANLRRQTERNEREQREIERLMEFFEKWKNTPSKRSQAVMRKRWAERIRAQATGQPAGSGKTMKLVVSPRQRSGDEVVIVDRLTKRFGARTLFEEVSLLITRGQQVGIVGPNGAGKSTFIRMLLGYESVSGGHIRLGANVTVGYFAQEASELDLEATVIENMMDVAEMLPVEARTYLGRFLFTGDDVFRKVADLSGGEKNKLALAQLTYLRPNLLVLDEPTNHLDIASREALTEMLRQFDGTLLLASHDRYLLDQVTTHTLEIAGGHAVLYDGPYRVYREIKERQAVKTNLPPPPIQNPKSKIQNPLTAGMNSFQLSRERKRAVKSVAEAEQRVEEAEDWLKRIEEALSAPMPGDDMVKLARDYERAQTELTQAMHAWEEAVAYAEGIGAAV
jgi:ATP-binding cassette subfamily F protein 3